MADRLNGLIFSEFLVDNPSGSFDTDGDGTANKSDEFIELQNTTGSTISLDGYEVWSDNGGLLYAFGPGDTIGPGQTATIVGEYTGTPPAGFYDAGLGDGDNFLPDGEGPNFDTIYLVNTATGEYIRFSYGNPPQPPSPPPGFPGTTLSGSGESLTSDGPNGTSFLRDANGDFTESSPTPGSPGVACYAEGTLIETPDGWRAVEALRTGDAVMTLDDGPATVRFMLFDQEDLTRSGGARPVEIKAGALGPGRPERDLVVSANHRILVGGQGQLAAVFPSEVFVPAKTLTALPRVRAMAGKRRIRWCHFLLAGHSVVLANGCFSESMLPGPVALSTLRPSVRRALERSAGLAQARHPDTARPCLSVRDAVAMLNRAGGDAARNAAQSARTALAAGGLPALAPRPAGHPALTGASLQAAGRARSRTG